jgi:hypothetical protein
VSGLAVGGWDMLLPMLAGWFADFQPFYLLRT